MHEQFRIDIEVSPWLFNVYMDDASIKEVKIEMGSRAVIPGDYLSSYMQMTWFCVVS